MATEEKTFESEFDKILAALGIVNGEIKENIIKVLTKFSTNNKIKLIDNIDITSLTNTDVALKELLYSIKNENTEININKTIENLAKLQGLILLENIQDTTNCDEVVNNILNAFDNKLKAVNKILETRFNKNMKKRQVQITNNVLLPNDNFKHKYLKYKMKYLKLRNN